LTEIKIRHKFRFINQAPLNESNQDISVNFIEYREEKFDNCQVLEIMNRF